ncbi:MAG: thioredoxin [Dorea sp.]|jgi:thioredoxin 1|nr:thioredoxin [Dorea sp.]
MRFLPKLCIIRAGNKQTNVKEAEEKEKIMAAIHVTAEDFKQVVLDSDKPVLVDFWAEWCGPCQTMGPIVEELSAELSDMKVCKLDIDKAMEIARQYRVMSIPTFLVFEGGEVTARTVGEQTKAELKTFAGR